MSELKISYVAGYISVFAVIIFALVALISFRNATPITWIVCDNTVVNPILAITLNAFHDAIYSRVAVPLICVVLSGTILVAIFAVFVPIHNYLYFNVAIATYFTSLFFVLFAFLFVFNNTLYNVTTEIMQDYGCEDVGFSYFHHTMTNTFSVMGAVILFGTSYYIIHFLLISKAVTENTAYTSELIVNNYAKHFDEENDEQHEQHDTEKNTAFCEEEEEENVLLTTAL